MPDCNVKEFADDTICHIYPISRQPRVSIPKSSIHTTTAPFQLIHIDVWGPYKVKSYHGCSQFLTIVDDFSSFTWIHLIKAKTDVVTVMNNFDAYVST